jgi:hypothetical protein
MTYSESRLSEFERSIAEIMTRGVQRAESMPSLSLGGIDPAAFENLQRQVALLMERNAQLEELAKAPKRRL